MSSNSTSRAAADLVIEPGGQLPILWGIVFAFGNLFAVFWLVRAFLNAHPDIAYQVKLQLARLGLGRRRAHKHRTTSEKHHVGSRNSEQYAAAQDKAATITVSSENHATAAVGSGTVPSRLSAEYSANGQHGSIPKRASVDSTGSARRHHHRHNPPPIICVPSAEVMLAQSPSAASTASSITPRRSFHTANGLTGSALDTVRSDSPEGSSISPDSCSSLSSEDDSMKEPVELEWVNMCYSVNMAAGKKYIVQGIYGCAKPHQLQGLMGPSGAGKSTLMDLLAMRTPHDAEAPTAAELAASLSPAPSPPTAGPAGSPQLAVGLGRVADEAAATADAGVPLDGGVRGGSESSNRFGQPPPQLLVNGVRMKRQAYMSISAYVPQHDNLVPTMTAYEAVSFYASIILPFDTPKAARKARIARVLRMMGLTEQQHTLVGGFLPGGIMLRGMSGGERKRLAIACGVVAGPSLVFLDEPTSGLDSFAALNVVLFLKNMATERGASMLASLHQPRAAIWSQLDQVTLLANGRLMYTGPPDQLVSWFTSLGYRYDLTEHGMASDWALDLVALGFSKPRNDVTAGGSTAADTEQQAQQQGSLRYRGSAAAVAQQSQQLQVERQPSMMSSKQQLFDAAEAFLQKLRQEHAEWFKVVPTSAAASASAIAASSSTARAAVAPSPAASPTSPATLWVGNTAARPTGDPGQQQPTGLWRGASADAGYDDAVDQDVEHQHQQGQHQEKLEAAIVEVTDAGKMLEDAGPFARQQHHGMVVVEQKQQSIWASCMAALHKYRALLWRELLITTRNPADVGGRMMTFTYVAFISGLVSWNLPGTADSMFNRMSVCYAILTFYFLMPFVFMSIFTSDKRFFAADTTARLYHPAQYYLSKVTVTMPFNIIVAVVFHLIYYGMTGLRHGAQFIVMSCLICMLTGLIGMQAIYCCAVAASSQDLAFVFAIAFTALNLLVNPYMSIFDTYSLGWGFSWLRFFSPCSFAWQALIRIEFGGRGFDCNQGSGLEAIGLIPSLLPRPSTYAEGPLTAQQRQLELIVDSMDNLGRFSGGHCVANGDAIVNMFTMGLSFGEIVAILVGYFLIFLVATYLVVARSSKKQLKA